MLQISWHNKASQKDSQIAVGGSKPPPAGGVMRNKYEA